MQLRDKLFHVFDVGRIQLRAYADADPYIRANEFEFVQLGPAEIHKLTADEARKQRSPVTRAGGGWYICKYDPGQPRIFLAGCSDQEALAVAREFGMEAFDLGHDPDWGDPCPASDALARWAPTHPRKAAEWAATTNYGFWTRAALSDSRPLKTTPPAARRRSPSKPERPLPSSKQRAAEFRAIASAIVRADRAGAPNLGQEIGRALEAAFQRGAAAAIAGGEPEPVAHDHLPWVQIPPRARSLFTTISTWTFGHPTSVLPNRARDAILIPTVSQRGRVWALYHREDSGSAQYDKIGGAEFEWSESTATKLEQLRLLERGQMADGSPCLMMSQFGFNTCANHVAGGGDLYD